MRGKIITRNDIRLNCRADTWEEAIATAGEPLTSSGSIEPSYIERMIDSVRALGPYIVIMPGLALAHAAPGDDVHRSDLSLAAFKDEIRFCCENDPVTFIICLACTNATSHLARLRQLTIKLMESNFVDHLRRCSDVNQVFELINA